MNAIIGLCDFGSKSKLYVFRGLSSSLLEKNPNNEQTGHFIYKVFEQDAKLSLAGAQLHAKIASNIV
jgi:hypothetical protein